MQEWRAALWRLCHGSLSAHGGAACAALRPEALAHAWLRLRKALQGLAAAAPAVMDLPEAAALSDAAGRMDAALGLAAGRPAKPYLWKSAGHPEPPPTAALAAAAARLAALADLTRAEPHRWEADDPAPHSDPDASPAARLAAAGVALPEGACPQSSEPGAADDGRTQEHEAELAAVAAVSADWGLRGALLEGAGLFALAVQRLREAGPGTECSDAAPAAAAAEALAVVELAAAKVRARVQEARPGGLGSGSRSHCTLPHAQREGTYVQLQAACEVPGRQPSRLGAE